MSFCSHCGKELEIGARFCSRCGRAVAQTIEAERCAAFAKEEENPHLSGYAKAFGGWDEDNEREAPRREEMPSASPQREEQPFVSVFSESNWRAQWRNAVNQESDEIGILLINTANSAEAGLAEFYEILGRFVKDRADQGVTYRVLDLANECVAGKQGDGSVENVVEVLRTVAAEAPFKYLLIIGDRKCVASIRWENGAEADVPEEYRFDAYVDSDLPYASLCTTSPWEGVRYCTENFIRVGRVPASAPSAFAEARVYLSRLLSAHQGRSDEAFGLTTASWEETSRVVFGSREGKLLSSPPVTLSYLRTRGGSDCPIEEPSLLYFNLHGSNRTDFWYGEEGDYQPETFDASCLPEGNDGYVLVTEACYGAKPVIRRDGTKTILLSALTGGCAAFVGSTQVAYGAGGGYLSCADCLAQGFLQGIDKGKTVGDAFVDGLGLLMQERCTVTTIKTLAEFALYGDPSYRMGEEECVFTSFKRQGLVSKRMERQSVTVERQVEQIGQVQETAPQGRRLEQRSTLSPLQMQPYVMRRMTLPKVYMDRVNRYVAEKYPAFASGLVGTYETAGYNMYEAIYVQREGSLTHSLRVEVDSYGLVGKAIVSK